MLGVLGPAVHVQEWIVPRAYVRPVTDIILDIMQTDADEAEAQATRPGRGGSSRVGGSSSSTGATVNAAGSNGGSVRERIAAMNAHRNQSQGRAATMNRPTRRVPQRKRGVGRIASGEATERYDVSVVKVAKVAAWKV